MRIVLHAGLHKSGTTTLQNLLGKCFGEIASGADWYPLPHKDGPGHADIVWSLLGAHGREKTCSKLDEIFRLAETSGVARILLSSEEFTTAWPSHLSSLHKLLHDHETELIFTVTSNLHRAISFWKETVKHGSLLTLEQSFVVQLGGFSPTIFQDFIRASRPQKTSLIVVNTASDPFELIRTFWEAARLDASKLDRIDKQASRLNVSFGAIETEVIRTINSLLQNKDHAGAPPAAQYLMNDVFLRAEWQEHCPRTDAIVPTTWIEAFQAQTTITRAFISLLAASGVIEVFGSLDAL